MSGTSADGVDAVLAGFAGDQWDGVVASARVSYPAALRAQVLHLGGGGAPSSLAQLLELDARIGECFARAAQRAIAAGGVTASAVAAIGCHGQTVCHQPRGERRNTLQLGDPNRVAARCGVPVVADFRRLDLALGGQGAPLVPAFHHALFAICGERRAVVNLGGIANVTLLPGTSANTVRGYDIGPGNALLDEYSQQHFGHRFDAGGRTAASGSVDATLLAALLADPYFHRQPPKSTGRDYFNLNWVHRRYPAIDALPAITVQATLCELTAMSIATAIKAARVQRLLVCGGGARNRHLLRRIQALTAVPLESTGAYGLPAQQVEAAAFAWLAWRRVNELAGNLPAVTGARHAAVLGGLYLPHPSR